MKKIATRVRNALNIMPTLKDEQLGLFIPNRQVSLVAAAVLASSFLCFMLGYFWGHKQALDRFVAKVEEESFADRINYALYTMNNRDISEFETEVEETQTTPALLDADDQIQSLTEDQDEEEHEGTVAYQKENAQCLQEQKDDDDSSGSTLSDPLAQTAVKPAILFVAPLAGFGTLHAATDFIKRVQLIDPTSIIEKRISKTPKGRTITWYQAMTGDFETKEDLQKFLSVIQKREHIKDIKIIEKRKG